MKITFTVNGAPVPKGRPRFGKGRTFTPSKTLRYEQLVKLSALTAGVRPTSEQVSLSVAFYLPTLRRVDVDNLGKSILDGLNRVAFNDDSQVAELHLSKALDRANPRAVVTVERAWKAPG